MSITCYRGSRLLKPMALLSPLFSWWILLFLVFLLVKEQENSTVSALLHKSITPASIQSISRKIPSSLSIMSATTTSTPTKSSSSSFDLIVVGGGSAGLTAAKFASQTLKKSCLLIEGQALGGDCTWTGCVPSKSLLASAKAAQIVRQYMTSSSSSSPSNWSEIQQRFQTIQQEIYEKDDSPEALAKMNIQTVEGMATLTSSRTVSVSVQQQQQQQPGKDPPVMSLLFEATQGIVLCTGATPKNAKSLIPGLQLQLDGDDNDDNNQNINNVEYITYEEVWKLKELPKRLTVVGGGPIGCELAQAFSRLGSQVTIIASRLLPREEPEVSELLQQVFEQQEGITVVSGRLESVTKNADGSHTASASVATSTSTTTPNNKKVADVVGDVLLVSIGRVPNTKGLGLETVGIELDASKNGGIKVNDKLETTCKGIYAAGDCTGDKQFTHYAGYQGAIAARNILLPLSDPGVLSDVPACTFTSPEIASIGYTEAQARKELGDDVVGVSKRKLDEVDRALCDGNRIGILKVLYHKRNGKILGATIMAPAAGELISEIAVARSAGMTFDALAKVIHPYPSYAMALQLMAADVYYEKTTQLLWLYNFLKRIGL